MQSATERDPHADEEAGSTKTASFEREPLRVSVDSHGLCCSNRVRRLSNHSGALLHAQKAFQSQRCAVARSWLLVWGLKGPHAELGHSTS